MKTLLGLFVIASALSVTSVLAADTDGDGIDDAFDNCVVVANANQRDMDLDGIGNMCDADFDQDCRVNFPDLLALRDLFFSADPVCDLDGDGMVNFVELSMMRKMFFNVPGPSGIPNDCD